MKTLIIAEIGNNHNGDFERAKRLIDKAKIAGADIAKFQMRNMQALYRGGAESVEDLGVEYTKDILNKYELELDEHKAVFDYCQKQDIEYMCTPWDLVSLEFLEAMGVSRYKIASADFNNNELIEAVAKTQKPIIFSTGMASTEEIKQQVLFIKNMCDDFTILHCNSTYPAPFHDIELNFLKTLKKFHHRVGYSGHERGIAVSVAAVGLGARVIERHLTEDKELEGPDHHASLLPSEFKLLVDMIKEVEAALGDEVIEDKSISQGALLNKEILGKSIVVLRNLNRGDILSKRDVEIKSPGQGMAPNLFGKYAGMPLQKNKYVGEFLFEEDFVPNADDVVNVPKHKLWGVPVRGHDVKKFHEIFDASVYEFHISYKDLSRKHDFSGLDFLAKKKIVVHVPELFENSMLLNLCDTNPARRKTSISNLQMVDEFCGQIIKQTGYNKLIEIVANVGGFSTHDFVSNEVKSQYYDLFTQSVSELSLVHSRMIVQNMAPFPWHFGGQRYQNIFMVPDEIVNYCEKFDMKICLDTAHLAMFCCYFEQDFKQEYIKLLPWCAHIHMSDSRGLNGEGVTIGDGDVPFEFVCKNIPENVSFILETWQGHKNTGLGFRKDLAYIQKIGG